MLGPLLHLFGSVHVACETLILLHSIRRFVKSSSGRRIEDRISALPDDLLVTILLFLPTKDAGLTVVLSKRWRSVWKMLPQLVYMDSDYKQTPGKKESILWFIDQSLQLHNAHVLERLVIKLGPSCSVHDVDVGKWVGIAADRRVRRLNFELGWLLEPVMLPERFYICNTLVRLTIFDKVLVDVPSQVCMPSLEYLCLDSVVYKDEDGLVRLLSACRVLKQLDVRRQIKDNLKNIIVKVPSLKTLFYTNVKEKILGGSLVIDSVNLRKIFLQDASGNSCSIENKPRLDKALINVFCYLDDKFRRSLSSVRFLEFILNAGTVDCCNTINFSQLVVCKIYPYNLHWLAPFICLLQNCPKLKVLLIDQTCLHHEYFPLTFDQPSCVPECLSNHLEIFEWEEYGGRNGEKEVVRYILANSKCLKRAGIAIEPTCDRTKMMKELESMSRVSSSSQLLFSTQLKIEWRLSG